MEKYFKNNQYFRAIINITYIILIHLQVYIVLYKFL